MKLAFVLAAWTVAAISGTVYLWGLAAHFKACRDFFRGMREMVTATEPGPFKTFGWFEAGVLFARSVFFGSVVFAFFYSLYWASL